MSRRDRLSTTFNPPGESSGNFVEGQGRSTPSPRTEFQRPSPIDTKTKNKARGFKTTPPNSPFPPNAGHSANSPQIVRGLKKRVDSIVLLKDFHGYNTLHDDNLDSPVPPPPSPSQVAPSSPYTPVPIPKSRLNRVDSITLLHRMNNLYTEDAETGTPRYDKLRKANEKFSEAKDERERSGSTGSTCRASRMSWVEDIETTTYIDEQKAPKFERRDSITLQQTLNGSNTVFGVHSDSPRWKKVAAINRKRAKMKTRLTGVGPSRVGALKFDDSDGDEEKESYEKEAGESKDYGDASAEAKGIGHRGRVDSVQLHRETQGNNTADLYINSKTVTAEPDSPDSPKSPRTLRVRKLNRERRRNSKNTGTKKKGGITFD